MPSDSFEQVPQGVLLGNGKRKSAFNDINPSDGTWSPARAIVFVLGLTILSWTGVGILITALF